MPVSEGVLSIMPQNAPLTLSIQNGINATYGVMAPDSTLLSMLGIILPIPFGENIVSMFGTIPGISIGNLFIWVGLLGVTQGAMVLPRNKKVMQRASQEEPVKKEPVKEAEVVKEKKEAPKQVKQQPAGSKFDSRTEELFFEENPLPKDPLDKIFADNSEQTKRVKNIKNVKYAQTMETDAFDFEDDIDMLTKPIGTGIINNKEVREKIKKVEPDSDNGEGFFTTAYQKGKEKEPTVEIKVEEIVQAPVEPKKEEVVPEATTIEIEPVEEVPVVEEEREEKAEARAPLETFDLNQLNMFIDSVQDEGLKQNLISKITEVIKNQNQPEEKPEPEEEKQEEPKKVDEIEFTTNFTPVEKKEDTTVIELPGEITEPVPELKEEREEIEETPEEVQEPEIVEEPVEEVKEEAEEISTKPEEIPEEVEVEETPGEIEAEKPREAETQTKEPQAAETEKEVQEPEAKEEPEEVRPEVKEEEISEVKEPEVKEETEPVTAVTEEEETSRQVKPVKLKIRARQPVKLTFKEASEEEELTRELPKLSETIDKEEEITESVSSEDENSDKIEVQEKTSNQEETSESEGQEIIETTQESDNQEEDVLDSGILLDENMVVVDRELLSAINPDLLGEIISADSVVSTKRGSFIQDEGSGYFVNKAYKEEKANMDRSEEEMLNVWAQVSRQDEDRKMNRRRQASRNYQTSNPYREEIERNRQEQEEQTRLAQERYQKALREKEAAKNAYIDKTQEVVNTGAIKDVKDMTDEEREAAGYKRVEIKMNGKTLSFWQKKN